MGKRRPPRGSDFRVRQAPEPPFVWLPRALLESAPYRALGIHPKKFLDLLMIENSMHSGQENGRLIVTYTQAIAYGLWPFQSLY